MTSLRTVAVLVVVAAVVLEANAAPQPFNLGKTLKKGWKKVSGAVSPTLDCLKKAGAGDAALGYLSNCGSTKAWGKTAMAGCAAGLYAPADVKAMLKSSANCFNLG